MEGSVMELSKYRFERAEETLADAVSLAKQHSYESSVNRAYYSVFHALRAVVALDGFDSSKHSGVIAYFNKEYVKTGIFQKQISKIIDSEFRLREKADYDDFVKVTEEMALAQIEKTKEVIDTIRPYLEEKWGSGKE